MKNLKQVDKARELSLEIIGKPAGIGGAAYAGRSPIRGASHGTQTSLKMVTSDSSARQRRTTHQIPASSARAIIQATYFAIEAGLPFNRFVTIHWDAARVKDDQAATARFLKLASDWARLRDGVLAFAWVRENGFEKGCHVHILLHLPADLVVGFNRRQRGWLSACGAEWKRGVILSRPIGRSLRQAFSGGADYEQNLSGVLHYILKGADHEARLALGISRNADGGSVSGKRCGCSQNIGPLARRRHQLGVLTRQDGGSTAHPPVAV